jgi:tetratricopeptide (TPR) repeat protein
MYIHLMEMSPSPESALPIADHLRGLVPDGGHLHHMPTHLDVLCGQYEQAITSNSDAIVADERFLSQAGPINFYTLYRAHDYHFRVYAAMFAGKYQVAIETVERLESSMPKSLLQVESPPMADWLEAFLTLRAHVLIRFGRWEDLIKLELPEDQQLYCMTTAITHYAKGVAFAASGRVREAEDQRRLFQDAVEKVAPSRTLFNNTCSDILQVAEAMLDGELEYRLGHFDAAYEHLRKAIDREDNLPYDEPWGWMQPTRHAYGALLLEQGHVEKALEVYMADLGMTDALPRALRHENNVWALHGVHECLLKLGRESEAKELEGKLSAAVAAADVPVHASCFCRLETESKCKSSGACKA